MTLITCLHHLLLHSRSHERSISAFVLAICCQSLCSYVRVAKGYLCLHCQAGAVRTRDQCHVLLTQHNQENTRMSPDPSLRGVGSGHKTTPGLPVHSFAQGACVPGVNYQRKSLQGGPTFRIIIALLCIGRVMKTTESYADIPIHLYSRH